MTIEPAAVKRLEEFPFPGNIRELQNLIERGVIGDYGNFNTPRTFGIELRASY